MSVDHSELMDFIKKLDRKLQDRYVLAAAGGTALTLHGLKDSTRDMDFVVDSGNVGVLRTLCDKLCDMRIDLFGSGMVFWNNMPSDYLRHATKYGSFEKIDLFALSLPDVIITKSARLNENDWSDIRSCVNAVDWRDVVQRYGTYGPIHGLRNNMTRVLTEIFGVTAADLP